MLNCIPSRIFDVIKGLLRIHLIPLCYLADSLGTEGPFGVDVDNFPISPAFFFWQLGSNTESVSQLSLPSPKLAKSLSDGHGFDASAKQFIEDSRPCGNPNNIFPFLC